MTINPHPRLLASSLQLERLKEAPNTPLLRRAFRSVKSEAEHFLKVRELTYDPLLHNSLLNRTQEMQHRILTLLVRWKQTGRDCYRQAVLDDVRDMGAWEYWSWDKWREKNPDPQADFNLSYGENSATLALAYDWLHSSLSPQERAMFLEIASRWSFGPFLALTEEGQRQWWFGICCNWNTVCTGGAGMLALAMLDDLPEAAEVLRRAEISITPYFEALETTRGGWIEGIGYWNYGHRYGFWYLLSHERTTGMTHPLLELHGTSQTLDFPLDFCPNGQACGFGDANGWSPIAFHYAAAERLGRNELIESLDLMSASETQGGATSWPNAAELLVFHPRVAKYAIPTPARVSKLYQKIDWGILSDQRSSPGFYLSIRGGIGGWDAVHSHLDLLSFNCVIGKERLIENCSIKGGKEYLDTTFSGRRFELYETTPASKNTVLINGVGITNTSSVTTTQLAGEGWTGFRLDASSAMDYLYAGLSIVRSCVRLFLLLEGPCAIVLDRVELHNTGRMETRLHTLSRARFGQDRAEIHGRKERLQLAFASNVPSELYRAEDALTTPGPRSTMLRWCTLDRTHKNISMATFLVAGQEPAALTLEELPCEILLHAKYGTKSNTLRISPDLFHVNLE